jgi:predicted RNA-binding protein associated with RNAse of E/G family
MENVVIEYLRPPGPPAVIQSELLHDDGNLTVFRHALSPSSPIEVEGQVVLAEGFTGVWFLYAGEAYDIGRIHDHRGVLTGYYCDMVLPLEHVGPGRYAITDLFLDLWISPGGHCSVLDREEFNTAVESGALSAEQAQLAEHTLRRLLEEAARGTFPPALVTQADLFPAGNRK